MLTDARVDLITKRIVQQKVHSAVMLGMPEAMRTPQLAVALRRALVTTPIYDILEVAVPYHSDLDAEIEDDGSVTVLLGHGEDQTAQAILDAEGNTPGDSNPVLP